MAQPPGHALAKNQPEISDARDTVIARQARAMLKQPYAAMSRLCRRALPRLPDMGWERKAAGALTCVQAQVLRVRLGEQGLDAAVHEQTRRRCVLVQAASREALHFRAVGFRGRRSVQPSSYATPCTRVWFCMTGGRDWSLAGTVVTGQRRFSSHLVRDVEEGQVALLLQRQGTTTKKLLLGVIKRQLWFRPPGLPSLTLAALHRGC